MAAPGTGLTSDPDAGRSETPASEGVVHGEEAADETDWPSGARAPTRGRLPEARPRPSGVKGVLARLPLPSRELIP
ncbi:MAG: hypothetical protein M3252_09090, partial [Actinomycetota bacterium]|nr:hypothetical protein [Actinomycetota bacterium]